VHLNLSDGAPTADRETVTGLLDDAGNLRNGPERALLQIARGTLPLDEVEREWDAQIQKVRDAGIEPTHLDGHKHVQMLPGLLEIALRLAKQHGVGAVRLSHESSSLRALLASGETQHTGVVLKQGVQARGLKLLARDVRVMAERAGISCADYFCGIAQTGELTYEGVSQLLQNLPEGTTELMCHPGWVDEALKKSATRLQSSRQEELEILTDMRIRKLIASQGIRLIDYGFVGQEA
jgi:predicted glycoside hydrolase/deacetylase ChbG (UPF0249 family)